MFRKLGALAIFGASALFVSEASADTKEWRYYSVTPATHPYSELLIEAFDRIKERTDGELSIRLVYFGETPYRGAEAPQLMRDGLGEMTEWLLAYSTSTYPLLSGPQLPFLPEERLSPEELVTFADTAWESPAVSNYVDGLLDNYNTISLGMFYWPPQNHWLSEPIEDASGFSGLRIREFSEDGINFLEALGATPVSLTAPEVYTALQRGTLDGVTTASTSMTGLQWGEVLGSGFITNFKLANSLMVVSENHFNQLSPEAQEILHEEISQAGHDINAFMIGNEPDLLERLESEYGFTNVMASDEVYTELREVARNEVWPVWLDSTGAEGQEILDGIMKSLGISD